MKTRVKYLSVIFTLIQIYGAQGFAQSKPGLSARASLSGASAPLTTPTWASPLSFLSSNPGNSSQAPTLSLIGSPSSSSSSGSSNNDSSAGSQQSLQDSVNGSYATSNSSYSIPGQYVPKAPLAPMPASTAKEGFVRMGPGWVVSYEVKIQDPKQPTLVMMPGIFRGLEKEEDVLKLLEFMKVNFVSIQFSTHAKSFMHLEAGETPYFEGGQGASTSNFAKEVEAVVDTLKIKKPVIVALSYSAIVAPHLNPVKFPYIINAAPMGRFDEGNLLGGVVQKSWEYWMSLVPIYGSAYVEWAKRQVYYSQWNVVVNMLTQFRPELKDPDVFSKQVDGFVAMNVAAENFDLTAQNYQDGVKRAWIVGESEDSTRAYFQSVAIKTYLAKLSPEVYKNSIFGVQGVFIVKGAGHIIPSDQPMGYDQALKTILDKISLEIKK